MTRWKEQQSTGWTAEVLYHIFVFPSKPAYCSVFTLTYMESASDIFLHKFET